MNAYCLITMNFSGLYCARHRDLANCFVNVEDERVPGTVLANAINLPLYEASNAKSIPKMEPFLKLNGEVSLFALADDNIICELREEIEKLEDSPSRDVKLLYDMMTKEPVDATLEMQSLRDFVNRAHQVLEADGPAAVLGFLTANGVENMPLQLKRIQVKGSAGEGLNTAVIITATGSIMKNIFYNDPHKYGKQELKDSFTNIRSEYKRYMMEGLSMFHKNDTPATEQMETICEKIYAFETACACLAEPPSMQRRGECAVKSFSTGSKFVLSFLRSWVEFATQGCELDFDPQSVLQNLAIFQGNRVEETCRCFEQYRGILRDYICWLCIVHFSELGLPLQYKQLYQRFYLCFMRGQVAVKPCWFDAVTWIKKNMEENAADIMRNKANNNLERREKTTVMVHEMLQAARDEILNVDHWPGLTTEAKNSILKHLEGVTVSVGVPAHMHSLEYNLNSSDGVVKSMCRIFCQRSREVIRCVHTQPQELFPPMNVLTANACYDLATKSIIVTEPMALPPFYGQSARFIVAHEIVHAFDDEGSKQILDLPSAARKGFQEFCKAMVEFSKKAKNKTDKVEEDLTLGENIADLIGFRVSLRDFQDRFVRENQCEPSEIDILTFYYQYARMWAYDATDVIKKTKCISDPHERANTRVLLSTAPLPPYYGKKFPSTKREVAWF